MIARESRMALERERERERVTLLDNRFFEGRILLNVLKTFNRIDKLITGIDCITVNVSKRNIYGDMAYPFCV